MPLLLNNPVHWQFRAREARLLAKKLDDDPEAKAAILKIADEYDGLAARAAERRAQFGSKRDTSP